ncbi:hypothetical protein D3C84_870440 [compost metagenome]
MVHQADLAKRTETAGEHVADVIGFTQEHALLAVTADSQGVQLDRRGRSRHIGQRVFEQAALCQQSEFKAVGQQLAVGIAYSLTIGPRAALHGAIGQHQRAASLIIVAVELADVEAAI